MEERIERDCELCWGKDEAVIPDDRCGNCRGTKTVPVESLCGFENNSDYIE